MQGIFSPSSPLLYNYVAIKKGFPNNFHFVILLIPTAKMNLVSRIESDRINKDFGLAQKCSWFILQEC